MIIEGSILLRSTQRDPVPPLTYSEGVLGTPPPLRLLPWAPTGAFRESESVLSQLDIPPSQPPFIGDNKWGGIITFNKRANVLLGVAR